VSRTQAVTILFCDLVRSTERRARLGDDAFDEFTGRFLATLRAAIADAGGREVSSAGDGLMVVFPASVADAIACATTMHRAVAELDPDDPPRLRIGISCGEVAQDGNDYAGMPIVEAARLEAAATPGRTLANAVVRSLVGTRRSFRFRDVGPLTLKGIPAPLPAVEVVDEDLATAPAPPPAAPARPAPRRPGRRRTALVAGVLGAVVLVAAAAAVAVARDDRDEARATAEPAGPPKPVGYSPAYEAVRCPQEVQAAASEATCGHLVVPEDRDRPQGRHVSLLVTRAPPRTAGAHVAPSIDLCGCEDVGNSLTRDHSELIQLSARGFHGSDPQLSCPEMSAERTAALARPANDPAEVAAGSTALAQCQARIERQGIDPAQYNYRVAAEDALDLMVALHIDRADFTASELVAAELFEVLRRAPGVVRSITIDNPAPPGETELSDPVADLSTAFGRYVARCEADPRCVRAYPDLAASWRAAYAGYERAPALETIADPEDPGMRPTPVLLDGPRAADALAVALGDARTYGLIPAAITTPGGTSVATEQIIGSDFFSFHPDAPWGTLASYLCAYDIHTEDPDAVELEATTLPQFTRGWSSHWSQWCTAWKVPDVSSELSADVVSPVPALLFRGDLTAFGNDRWLQQVERGLSHAHTVRFPTLGGGLLAGGPSCLSDLRRAFLEDPTAPLDTKACEHESPPIEFVAPG
jgi:class 3 adenylate cyclase